MTVAPTAASEPATDFEVHLENFEGPFDLLLGLIAKHQLDVTEVSLSKITDEFIAHLERLGHDLDATTSFLVVAATLLDLKTARLLPHTAAEDDEDLALLEARDLLFARLLQYRAFRQVAALIAERMAAESRRHPRVVPLEERYARLLPEVVLPLGAEQLAALAGAALAPQPQPVMPLRHLHASQVSVREQAALVVQALRRLRRATFRTLVADAPDTLTEVARFLALLELYGAGVVGFDQLSPLGELHVRWSGDPHSDLDVRTEFDEVAASGLQGDRG